MIQRIQSIYLLLALVSVIAMLFIPLYSLTITSVGLKVYNVGIFISNMLITGHLYDLIQNFRICIAIEIILFCLINVVTIFKYKNRKYQMKLCNLQVLLLFIAYGTIAYNLYEILDQISFVKSSNYFFLVLIFPIIFVLLAKRAIKKDEKLIRESNRIR